MTPGGRGGKGGHEGGVKFDWRTKVSKESADSCVVACEALRVVFAVTGGIGGNTGGGPAAASGVEAAGGEMAVGVAESGGGRGA